MSVFVCMTKMRLPLFLTSRTEQKPRTIPPSPTNPTHTPTAAATFSPVVVATRWPLQIQAAQMARRPLATLQAQRGHWCWGRGYQGTPACGPRRALAPPPDWHWNGSPMPGEPHDAPTASMYFTPPNEGWKKISGPNKGQGVFSVPNKE